VRKFLSSPICTGKLLILLSFASRIFKCTNSHICSGRSVSKFCEMLSSVICCFNTEIVPGIAERSLHEMLSSGVTANCLSVDSLSSSDDSLFVASWPCQS
jgi:hypothetical protein